MADSLAQCLLLLLLLLRRRYQTWFFFKYLTERFGPDFVGRMW